MGVIKPHIEITPGVCGGILLDTESGARHMIMHDRMGKDPYEIVNDYPSITDVYATSLLYG